MRAAGCPVLAPVVDVAEPIHARPQPVVRPTVNNGAIFQASQYRPLVEDHHARLVGDTLTVQVAERVNAKSTSSVDASGSAPAGQERRPWPCPRSS